MKPLILLHDEVTRRVIGAAIAVHRALGPGLLESVYQRCLAYELAKDSIPFQEKVSIEVHYDGIGLASEFVADFVVEE